MLSTEEIREIIEKGETGRVEFKSEREKNIDFAKEIAAFANGSGGYLLVGVEDDGTLSGVSNPLKFEEKIYVVEIQNRRKGCVLFLYLPGFFKAVCHIAKREGEILYPARDADTGGRQG